MSNELSKKTRSIFEQIRQVDEHGGGKTLINDAVTGKIKVTEQ